MSSESLTATIDAKLADARARLAQLENEFSQASFDAEMRDGDVRRCNALAGKRTSLQAEIARLEAARQVALAEDDRGRREAHESAVAILREHLARESAADAQLVQDLEAAWQAFREVAIRKCAQAQLFLAAAKALSVATGEDHTHAPRAAQYNRGLGTFDVEQKGANFRLEVEPAANQWLIAYGYDKDMLREFVAEVDPDGTALRTVNPREAFATALATAAAR